VHSFGTILAILIPLEEKQNTRNFNFEKNAPYETGIPMAEVTRVRTTTVSAAA